VIPNLRYYYYRYRVRSACLPTPARLPPTAVGHPKPNGRPNGGPAFASKEALDRVEADEAIRHAAFEALITETTVRTITASTLLRYVPSPVVYLQIDAEGHDDRVLLQFLSNDTSTPRCAPAAITFEHMLLSRNRLTAALSRLRAHGYTEQCLHGQNVVSQSDYVFGQ
jgi:hypothetical protein|tara:strand:- start:405 stop:908 length:504 start_codon:yes stop_codon:yes gene_type:complete